MSALLDASMIQQHYVPLREQLHDNDVEDIEVMRSRKGQEHGPTPFNEENRSGVRIMVTQQDNDRPHEHLPLKEADASDERTLPGHNRQEEDVPLAAGEGTNVRNSMKQQELPQQVDAKSLSEDNAELHEQIPNNDGKVVDAKNTVSLDSVLFQPVWLRKSSLIVLAAVFSVLAIASIILYCIAASEHGFSLTVTSSHYVWTYGPTVILTFVLGLWRQVDYYCKLTQPWRGMTAKSATPQQSVLLDYVSPMSAMSFYRALRNGHVPVILSIAVFVLLKVVIIISTGLLNMEPTLLPLERPVKLNSTFDPSKVLDGILKQNVSDTELDPVYNNITTDILWSYVNQLNGQPPNASVTKDDKVFQSLDMYWLYANTDEDVAYANATVDIFIPKVTCEAAQLTAFHQNETDNYVPVQFKSPSCSFNSTEVTGTLGQGYRLYNSTEPIGASEQLYDSTVLAYSLDLVYCATTTDLSGEAKLTDAHFAVAAAVYRNPTDSEGHPRKMDPDENALVRSNAVICKIDYNIRRADLKRTVSDGNVEVKDRNDSASVPFDMTSTDLSRYIAGSLLTGEDEINADIGVPSSALPSNASAFVHLMYQYHGSSANNESFFDPETLKDSATSVFQGLALQVAQTTLMRPADIDAPGTVTISADRLHVKKAPAIVMIVSLLLATCLALAVMVVVKRRVVPQKPGSIASYASVLARSSTLQPLLAKTGKMRTSDIRQRLDGLQYRVRQSDLAFEIEATDRVQGPVRITNPKVKTNQWLPWAARSPLLALVFILPLLIIAVLELLQRLSDKDHGVVELHKGDSDSRSYSIRYGSILVALLVATLFNNLDFTITTLTPFHALRSGTASAKGSISLNLVGQIPLLALSSCLRHRHAGTTLSISAAFIGSFLTIISSGLWVADNQVTDHRNVTNSLGSSWNLTWANNSADDGGAAKLVNAIDYGGSQAPVGTQGGFALPTIGKSTSDKKSGAVVDTTSHGDDSRQSFEFYMDGLLPKLECKVCPKNDIRYDEKPTDGTILTDGNLTSVMKKSLAAQFRLPVHCHNKDSKSFSNVSLGYSFTTLFGEPRLIGKIIDLNISSLGDDASSRAEGCPSIGIVYGQFDNITALLCKQRIYSVARTVTYSGDPAAGNLDEQRPPYGDDDMRTWKYMLDASTGLSTFSYQIVNHLLKGLAYFSSSAKDYGYSQHEIDIQPFFDHILNGPDHSIDAETEMRSHDREHDFIYQIDQAYNKYMVQVLHAVFRQPPTTNATNREMAQDGSEETVQATVDGSLIRKVTRLKMNNTSKLTLQIMLAVMIIMSGVAVRLIKIRGTLPRDPYSIASVMGFLAGSKMCDPQSGIIPSGSEFLNTRDLNKLFDGESFKLGWWSSSDEDMRASGRGEGRSGASRQRDSDAESSSSHGSDENPPPPIAVVDGDDDVPGERREMLPLRDKGNERVSVVSERDRRFGIDVCSNSSHTKVDEKVGV